jgi:hypothetical protein
MTRILTDPDLDPQHCFTLRNWWVYVGREIFYEKPLEITVCYERCLSLFRIMFSNGRNNGLLQVGSKQTKTYLARLDSSWFVELSHTVPAMLKICRRCRIYYLQYWLNHNLSKIIHSNRRDLRHLACSLAAKHYRRSSIYSLLNCC